MEDKKPNLTCANCRGKEFYLQDGLYFCDECDAQHENFREMGYDVFDENFTSNHRIKFAKSRRNQDDLKARRLTSFEEYNHILLGFIDEILNIEDIPDFKVTCLQLWISYLRVSEAAFFDKEKVVAPKLFAYYRKADAEILYNKKPKKTGKRAKASGLDANILFETGKQRRKKVRNSEKIISQQLSESLKSESMNNSMLANLSIDSIISDHENAELEIEFSNVGKKARDNKRAFRTNRTEADQIEASIRAKAVPATKRSFSLNGSTLLFIIYCALNICGSNIQLTDLIRFVLEGHLSFYKCKLFLPDELIDQDIELSHQTHHSYRIIIYETFRTSLSYFIRLIPDLQTSIKRPNLCQLAHRYLDEMQLPDDLTAYVERLMILLPPEMKYNERATYIPNFEGRAMAYIIFALKLLFGIDGYRDEEMSMSARKVNQVSVTDDQQKIFVYKDWMEFIEYRQCILGKFYHPTLFHRAYALEKPYLGFNAMLNSMNPKTPQMERQNITMRHVNRIRSKANAQEMLAQFMRDIGETKDNELMHQLTFHSFTPMKDYFEQIQVNDTKRQINQKIISVDYTKQSCDAFLNPKKLVETFKAKGHELRVKKSTFPKSFTFLSPVNIIPSNFKVQDFSMVLDGLTERQWQDDVRKRHSYERAFKDRQARLFHKTTMTKTAGKRKIWRQLVRENKSSRVMVEEPSSSRRTTIDNEPKAFTEPSLLSESDDSSASDLDEDEIKFDSSDDELGQIFRKSLKRSRESLEENVSTFVIPDFNLWHLMFRIAEVSPATCEREMEKLPRNFLWLLKFAANILQQHPLTVYYQLLCIEHQFLNVYQPVELMKSAMAEKTTRERQTGQSKLTLSFENAW